MSSIFGKFTLLERIGGGRLSQVFRVGRSTSSNPRVVLKRVNPELIAEESFVQLVVREAGLLSRLEHPNLCVCHEMGVIDGCAFLTIDLVDGCTLRALMRRLSSMQVKLPTSAVQALACQMAEVLDYLHRRSPNPLVHLDLSPQNVMISREGEVKLIDFGIARLLDGTDPPPLGGRIAGTVGYMSPEQARGETRFDARADQFGLGILLWEMIGGRRLFRGNTVETWQRMREGDVPDSRELAGVSSDFAHAVRRMLGARPDDRFPQMEEAAEILGGLSSSSTSGKRPLGALVSRLMAEEDFDPFDVVRRAEPEQAAPVGDIPTGEIVLPDYEELQISVDHGLGTPSARMRAVVPSPPSSARATRAERGEPDKPAELPSSPFLETVEHGEEPREESA